MELVYNFRRKVNQFAFLLFNILVSLRIINAMDFQLLFNRHRIVLKRFLLLGYVALIFLLVTNIKAQNPKIDSLRDFIRNGVGDTTMVIHLNALSTEIAIDNPSQAISYGEKARAIAEKINFQRGLGYAYKNIGMGHYHLGNYGEVLENWKKIS